MACKEFASKKEMRKFLKTLPDGTLIKILNILNERWFVFIKESEGAT